MDRVSAIIVAAGEGRRFGTAKQFVFLKGKTVLDWSLETFEKHGAVDNIVLVLGKNQSGDEYLHRYRKISSIARGGEKRQDSVYSGLSSVNAGETGIILVHDGARPLVGENLIERIVKAARKKGAVVPVIPVDDTIKRVEAQKVFRSEDRRHLFRTQTPQGYSYNLLKEAFVLAIRDGFSGTDEASLVERTGKDVFVIPGDRRNIKITTEDDMKIAEALIED